jgi:23S rRNA (guanosine2251-2'-O)-methyltransferase
VLHRLWLRGSGRRPELDEIRALAAAGGVPIEPGAPPTGGAASPPSPVELEVGPLPELDLEELVARGPELLVALDGVEDPQNLGAICRVSEAAGVGGLLLTRRRAPPLSPAVSRASAGALEHLPVARVANLRRALDQLREGGFWTLGADPGAERDLFSLPDRLTSGPLAVVLGAEGRGLRPGVRAGLDHAVRIPMRGHVGSLNVAAAVRRDATRGG